MLNRRLVVNVIALAAAAAFFGIQGPNAVEAEVDALTGELDGLPDALARASANVASSVGIPGANRTGRHLGFDTYAYPGDKVMRAWRASGSPYEWVGYYLPQAPCHKGVTWRGTRERLLEMGWGIAVVYVGQQTWDGTPSDYTTTYRTSTRTVWVKQRVKQRVKRNGKWQTRYVTKSVPRKRVTRTPVRTRFDASRFGLDDCNRNLPSTARGVMEGRDAIQSTLAEGFPPGTVIFLDLEYMPQVPQRMRDYYKAWTHEVLADGRFTPGYYVHKSNATIVQQDVAGVFAAANSTMTPSFWVAGGRAFHPNRRPHEIGLDFANVWQGELDTEQTWNGYRLPIDVNVAAVPSPSLTQTRGAATAD